MVDIELGGAVGDFLLDIFTGDGGASI